MNENTNQDLELRVVQLEQKVAELADKHSRLIDYVISGGATANKSTSSDSKILAGALSEPNLDANFTKAPASGLQAKQRPSSTQLLPLVSVICFILAAVFIVRLAVDSGWLTYERQWGLLTLLGLSLSGAGFWLKKIESSYRSYLSAAGAIVLYMSAYSSHLHFGIASQEVAFLFALAVTALCLYQYKEHRIELLTVITCLGTYLAPLLLSGPNDLVYETGFFIMWAGLFSVLASYLQSRTITLLACYLGIGVFTLLNAKRQDPFDLLTVISVLIAQFTLFCSGIYYYSLKHKDSLTQKIAMAHLPALLFFYGATYYFLDKWNPELAPWISFGFVIFIFLLYRNAQKHLQDLHSQNLVSCFMGVIVFHSGYMQILPDGAKAWLLPLFVLATYVAEKKDLYPRTSKIIKSFLFLVAAIEFAKISYHLLTLSDWKNVFPSLVTIGLGLFYYLNGSRLIQDRKVLFLGLLHLLTVLLLYRVAYDYGSLAVSAGWAIYSLMILGIGYVKRDTILAKSSLLVLTVTSLKALVYDASQTASGVRILSLLLTGAVLYGAGLLLKKINHWSTS